MSGEWPRVGADSRGSPVVLASVRCGAGFAEATLWVLAANERGRRFYEAAGWRADGAAKVDQSWGFPLHEVRYRRRLG